MKDLTDFGLGFGSWMLGIWAGSVAEEKGPCRGLLEWRAKEGRSEDVEVLLTRSCDIGVSIWFVWTL